MGGVRAGDWPRAPQVLASQRFQGGPGIAARSARVDRRGDHRRGGIPASDARPAVAAGDQDYRNAEGRRPPQARPAHAAAAARLRTRQQTGRPNRTKHVIALRTKRSRSTAPLATVLLILQGPAAGVLPLAHASEHLTAPARPPPALLV